MHDEESTEGFLERWVQCKRNYHNVEGLKHLKVNDSQGIMLGRGKRQGLYWHLLPYFISCCRKQKALHVLSESCVLGNSLYQSCSHQHETNRNDHCKTDHCFKQGEVRDSWYKYKQSRETCFLDVLLNITDLSFSRKLSDTYVIPKGITRVLCLKYHAGF